MVSPAAECAPVSGVTGAITLFVTKGHFPSRTLRRGKPLQAGQHPGWSRPCPAYALGATPGSRDEPAGSNPVTDPTSPAADPTSAPNLVEVLPPSAGEQPATDGEQGPEREAVSQPSKLIRIATMVKSMLEEVRHASLDDAGRQRLRQIHERSLDELSEVLSEDLREELGGVMLPFDEGTPSDSELRIAQAQLVGWLEGLFHGIQATMMTQQMMAQQQLEQMRRRALPPGQQPEGPGVG